MQRRLLQMLFHYVAVGFDIKLTIGSIMLHAKDLCQTSLEDATTAKKRQNMWNVTLKLN